MNKNNPFHSHKSILTVLICFAQITLYPLDLTAQEKYPDFIKINDHLLKKIVPDNVQIIKLAGDLRFTEGPVWSQEGFLLFSDIPANRVYKLKDTESSIFLEPSGNSNGLTFEPSTGKLILCEHSGRRVSRLEGSVRTTIVDNYKGKRLNSPNDIVYNSDGSFYFTDPPYGIGGDNSDQKELTFNGIYLYQDGRLTLLDSSFTRPNGIALSPDEQYLYVANSDPKDKYWKKFPVLDDGTLGEAEVLHRIKQPKGGGGPDGLKVDVNGNVYCTEHEGVWVFSSEGKHLGTIEFPEVPANCAWGGPENKTLYVTARNSVYKINLIIEGYVTY
jgi:gluconolactonase